MSRVVPAVVRALDLLDLFLDGTTSLSMPEVAARLSIPRATTHELVNTLVAKGYLSPLTNRPHRYCLGVHVIALSNAYTANLDLLKEGQEVARSVAAACDETIQMAVLEGASAVYILKVDSTRPVRLVSAIGRRLPAHCTGLGKMLLSGLSDVEICRRYGDSAALEQMTPSSIPSLGRLLQELAQIRARGFAFDDCESNLDVRCVAGPVYDHEGTMVAALSISVPITRMDPDRQIHLGTLIRNGAQELSHRLGYQCAQANNLGMQAASRSGS